MRAWQRQPLVTAAMVLVTGLSASATAVCLSAAARAVWRPDPLVDTSRLVRLHSVEPLRAAGTSDNTIPDLAAIRERARSFEAVAAYLSTDYNLTSGGTAVPIRVTFASHQLWTLARVPAALGRTFDAEHDRPGGDVRAVVLSDGIWRTMFGGDRSVVGRTVTLGTAPYSVLGVMPPGFAFPDRADAWLPLEAWLAYLGTSSASVTRGARSYAGLGQLRDGTTVSSASDELQVISASLAREYPASNRTVRMVPLPFARSATAASRASLFTALAAATVLWIAALAAVVAVRGATRRARLRTVAIQVALGATRRDLFYSALREAWPAALASALAGIAVAAGLTSLLVAAIPAPQPVWLESGLSPLTLTIAALLSVLPILAPPVIAACRERGTVLPALRDAQGRRTSTLVRAGAGSQLAIAATLLLAGGVVLGEVRRLRHVDPGFVASDGVAVFVSPPGDDVAPASRGAAYASFYDRVLEDVRRRPGVVSAGGVNVLPLRTRSGWQRNGFTAFGQDPSQQQWNPLVNVLRVSGGYFDVMRIPLLAGRDFDERDRRESARVAIVSRSLAERMWPGRAALGQQLKLGDTASASPWATVVGVAGDVRSASLARAADYDIYVSYRQVIAGELNFIVRSRGGEAAAVAAIEAAVQAANPHAAVFRRETLSDLVEESLWQQRISTIVLCVFSLIAIVVAAASTYGTVAAAVSSRRRELAIRAAVGADPGRLSLIAVAEAAAPLPWALAGFGLLAAGARPLLAGIVSGEAVAPWASAAAGACVLLLVGLAVLRPVREARQIDATLVLRGEQL